MYRSPILHALIAMMALFGILFLIFPADLVNDVLDAYAIAAGIFILVRYGKQIWLSMLETRPDGSQCLIVSIGLVATSIALLRAVREFGLELGVINNIWVKYVFAMITVVMVFGMFLKVIAPPMPYLRFEIVVRPWIALCFALASGTLLSVLILGIRELT